MIIIARIEATFGNANVRLDIASVLSFDCRLVYDFLC